MGCASSRFLKEEEGGVIVGATIGHHIVSLTSTTYGLLATLDQSPGPKKPMLSSVFSPPRRHRPPPPPPPPLPYVSSRFHLRSATEPEISDSPDIMTSFNFSSSKRKALSSASLDPKTIAYKLEMFPLKCPPGGENAAVLYTTSLRGIRKTFDDCNAVRSALQGLGIWFKERDISMDSRFREELRELAKSIILPKLFIRGRYIGGKEEILRILEDGGMEKLLEGLPKTIAGVFCDVCHGDRFLICSRCKGRKKVEREKGDGEIVRCPKCNENGLFPCLICCL